MNIQELRNQYQAAIARAETAYNAATSASRDMTAEETAAFDAAMTDAESLKAKIASAERGERLASARQPQPRQPVAPAAEGPAEPTRIGAVRERVLDDPQRGFALCGEFFSAVAAADPRSPGMDQRLVPLSSFSPSNQQSQGAEGGYLIPPAFSNQIRDNVNNAEFGSLMAMCDQIIVPYGVDVFGWPVPDETSMADGSRHGGIRGYWTSELTQATASRPTWRQVEFKMNSMVAFVPISNKLLRNVPSLEGYIASRCALELSFMLDAAILAGTGAGQPKGIVGAAGTVSVAKETGQSADTIVSENILKMYQRALPSARTRGVWLYDPSCDDQLQQLTINVGTGGQAVFMPPNGLSAAPYGTIRGRPAIPTQYAYAVGDNGDIIFADMKQYGLAIRSTMEGAWSMHVKFDYDQSVFRLTFEADGQPYSNSAITPYTPTGGTTKTQTLSSFVTLAARA